ncbi:hypothetical protein [Pseudoduganella sp.]|uniref:hypothetical protein n=1 Tax=Pseudoduganella sp. TaxID=1880898 RepID=UPI0035AEA82C
MKISRTLAAAVTALSFSHAQALDLQVKARQFDPTHIGFAADGARACLVGDNFDPDAAQNSGELLVVDYKTNALLWKKHIPAPNGYVALTAAQCAFDGEFVYVLANVNTQAAQSLNQTLVYILQFSADGKQTGYKKLSLAGRNKFAYTLAPLASGVQVAGYVKDEDNDAEYYSLFTVQLDRNLVEGRQNVRKTGAFNSSASARFVGERLYIAGGFSPSKLGKTDYVDDYAHSQLLPNGGYVWSVRPFKQKARDVKQEVSPRGVTYSLSGDEGISTLAVTSPEGKPLASASYEGRFCKTYSMAEYGNALLAVRQPCGGKGSARELRRISPSSGREDALQLAAGEPLFVAAHDGHWFLLSKDGAGDLSLNVGMVNEKQAADAGSRFKLNSGGVEHSLQVSRYQVDNKGVPSFDYVYEQRAGSCRFSVTGHAVAGFDESKGKVELEVFNLQDDDGKPLPQILVYYDDASTFTLPFKGAPRQVSFDRTLSPEQLKRSCGSQDSAQLSLLFNEKA